MTDKITGKPRGFGFIVFESPDGVAAVLRVNAAVQSVLFVCGYSMGQVVCTQNGQNGMVVK